MKELSSGRGDFAVAEGVQEISARVAAVPGKGIDECRIEMEGCRMRYLRAGSGPPLILLHGLLGYSFSWRFAMPALAPYATVYAPDLLGAGFSDRAFSLDHSVRATAKRVVLFAERLELSSFDLLGTSHGGAVAMMVAEECLAPDSDVKLNRLVLVAPVNPFSSHGKWLAPFFGTPLGASLFRLTIPRMPFLFPYWHRRMYGNERNIPPGTFEGYMAPLAIPGLFEHALNIVRTWKRDLVELETVLPKLAGVPTLIIWGQDDPAVYVSSVRPLAKFFPNSETLIFPGVGHLPYEECPEEFNRALIEFLTCKRVPA
ncbi:MAG TPA: alpha/beta hydrolase [Candidatus Sulfotelmatobacter sp.]|nr:alpha/beta hydrolase [Candidatus Sulfotelmatobacter sp.]